MSEEDSVDMDTFDAEKEMMEAMAQESAGKSESPFDAEKEMMEAMAQESAGKSENPLPALAPPPVAAATGLQDANLERLLDIPLVLSAQLGSTRMLIKDLLQLGPGSIVELDKLAGEPLEVLVNERLVARGEVVMVNEKFGIRLTDVISPSERVKKLK
jgi:flagellar motor switch protein FliN/FliY